MPNSPQIVKDAPSQSDSFGSHERIADAIWTLINEQHGGQSIGLEGDWGAGKSTVVKLLSQSFDNEQRAVFVFDAWAHQGDPLRRAFLESLISLLQEKKWLGGLGEKPEAANRRWDQDKEILSRRIKTSEKKSTPVFTGLGKVILSLLLFFPIGSALVGGAMRQVGNIDITWLAIGILVCASPLIAVLFAVVASWLHCKPTEDLWALLVQKSSTSETTTTIETPDPTTIEFQDIFKKLLGEALRDKDRRLLLVLDNLDRMNQDETKSIWSMLRSFIDNPAVSNTPWFQRLWVMIPYALHGFQREPTISNATEKPIAAEQQRNFLEKIVQIRFSVPTPVLSDWKAFLTEKLREAFPYEQDQREFFRIYRLWSLHGNHKAPKPRELIAFVNEVVALALQWDGCIPLSHQALYVLLRRSQVDILEGLKSRSIPSVQDRQLLAGEISNSLAALVFNVDAEKAVQILFASRLEDCLSQRSGEVLRDEYQNRIGFGEFMDHELGSVLSTKAVEAPERILIALEAISNSGIIDLGTNGPGHHIQLSISGALAVMPYWPLHDVNCEEGLRAYSAIFSRQDGSEKLYQYLRKTADWYKATLSTNTLAELSHGDPENFIYLISKTLTSLTLFDYLPSESLPIRIPLGGSWQEWFDACEVIVKSVDNPTSWRFFTPIQPNTGLPNAISNSISQGKFLAGQHAALRMAIAEGNELTSFGLPQQLKRRLQASGNSVENADLLVMALLELRTVDDSALTELKDSVTSGWAHHLLHLASTKGDAKIIGTFAFAIIYIDPKATFSNVIGQGQSGHQLLQRLLSKPEQHTTVVQAMATLVEHFDRQLPFRLYKSNTNAKNLAFALLREIMSNQWFAESLADESLVDQIRITRLAHEGNDLYSFTLKLVGTLMQQRDLSAYVMEKAFSESDAFLYFYLIENGAHKQPEFVSWLNQGLAGLSENDYLVALTEESMVLRVVDALHRHCGSVALPLEYKNALLKFAKGLAKGEITVSGESTYRRKATRYVQQSDYALVLDEIYEAAAVNAENGKHEQFFHVFGEALSDPLVVTNPQNKLFRRLIIPLARAQSEPGLSWLIGTMESSPFFIEQEPRRNVDELVQVLNSLPDESPVQKLGEQLLSAINRYRAGQ